MEHIMKILNKYIEPIKNSTKTKEFRLNNEKRQKIKIGDTLLLISNEDKNNYVRVRVNKSTTYSSWEEVVNEEWFENEFAFAKLSHKELIDEFHKYYRNDDIKKYGIVSFDIEPIIYLLKNSRVLIDTNTIIYRESYLDVNFEVSELYKWFNKLKMTKLIHPDTKLEISKYRDAKLKNSLLSKLNAYEEIVPNKFEDDNFKNVVSKYSQNKNSLIDNSMLLQVYLGIADFLVTNDKILIQKANELYLGDKVLNVTNFLKIIEDENPSLIDYKMLSVRRKQIGEIDLQNEFFDTLREDYIGFNDWFLRKNSEFAYIFEDGQDIKGFLYLKVEDKDEDYSDIVPTFKQKKRLKVGTFKIVSGGFRLGERFLKIIFDNAVENDVDEVYVTMFKDKRKEVEALGQFMRLWGFNYYGHKKSNGENVLIKNMKTYDETKTPMYNFPLTKESPNHYFLPIYPEFHTDLFPDSILKNENMNLYKDNLAHRYSIEKIYVTSAKHNPKPGDIVLIYRMGERLPKKYSSVLTGQAIIEEIIQPKDLNEYIEICSNKSVFRKDRLVELYNIDKWRKIVKLLYFESFSKKIILDNLHELNIVEPPSGPRTFDKISEDDYAIILKRSRKLNQ